MALYDAYLELRHHLYDGDPPRHVAVVITEQDLLVDGAYETLSAFLRWAFEYGAEQITVSVSVLDASVIDTLAHEFRSLDAPRSIAVHTPATGRGDPNSDNSNRDGNVDRNRDGNVDSDRTDKVDGDHDGDVGTTGDHTVSKTSTTDHFGGAATATDPGAPTEWSGDPTDAPIRVNLGLGGKAEFAAAVRSIATDVADGSLDPESIDGDHVADRLVFPAEPDLVIKTGAERLSDFAIWQSVYSELYFTDVNWRDFRKRDYLRAVVDFQDRQRRYGQ